MKRRRIVGVRAIAPQPETPKEEKKVEFDANSIKSDFMDVLYYQAKQRDGLLGEFSADGSYSIKSENILKGLIEIPKVLQELDNDNNVAYASTKIENVVLNFKIEFDMDESYCSAHLKIIEIERKYDESIKHIQNLDDVVEIYSPLFLSDIFKLWNVVRDPVELDKRNFVLNYLDMQERNKRFMKELSDILAQLYVMRMLQVLAGCGELGEKIIAEYNSNLEKLLSQDPAFSQDNSRLKDLLDQIIIKHKAIDIVIANGGAEVLKAYAEPINKLRGKEPEVVISPAPVVEKKSEKKASENKAKKKSSDTKSASKSGGKSKSKGGKGGGSKGGAPKTDDKKLSPLGLNFKKTEETRTLKPAPTVNPEVEKENQQEALDEVLDAFEINTNFVDSEITAQQTNFEAPIETKENDAQISREIEAPIISL